MQITWLCQYFLLDSLWLFVVVPQLTVLCVLGAAAQYCKYAYLKMDSLFILVSGMRCNRSHYFFFARLMNVIIHHNVYFPASLNFTGVKIISAGRKIQLLDNVKSILRRYSKILLNSTLAN